MASQKEAVKDLGYLERRHARLKQRVAEYESRTYLTDVERLDLQNLKKEKLATKDAMSRIGD